MSAHGNWPLHSVYLAPVGTALPGKSEGAAVTCDVCQVPLTGTPFEYRGDHLTLCAAHADLWIDSERPGRHELGTRSGQIPVTQNLSAWSEAHIARLLRCRRDGRHTAREPFAHLTTRLGAS